MITRFLLSIPREEIFAYAVFFGTLATIGTFFYMAAGCSAL